MTRLSQPLGSDDGRLGAQTLWNALARWANEEPDAGAVCAADGRLTFAELYSRVPRLAQALAVAGAGRGTPVGLGTGRSYQSLVALLAIWWLGGCAVLLDDKYRTERLDAILRDANARTLIGMPVKVSTPVVQVAADAAADGEAVAAPAHPDDLAYIVYTSGTTGRPKGVEIPYRGLDTFLTAVSTLKLKPGGWGVTAVSPAFDGWLWCVLLYLMHGQGVAWLDPVHDDLGPAIEALRPLTVSLTPSLLASCDADLPDVPVLIVAGETCPPALAARYLNRRRMLNVYGPTETTIAATWADSANGDDLGTIGQPLPGYSAYVMNENLQPVPPGEPGELCIGGPALARGYRALPALTAARFVPDPFAGAGSRMYRTGDLVRRRADGQLEFLGRLDDQVKLRGHRIEPAEVEHMANREPGVAAAYCLALSNQTLGLAVLPELGLDAQDLATRVARRCAATLPEFMCPSVVEVLEVFPLLATGKVDRQALADTLTRALTASGTEAGVGSPAPSSDREYEVCQVWNNLLPGPVPDPNANFFEIGGHSLLAARAVAVLRRRTGLDLSMRHFLANPTVAGIASEMDRLAAAEQDV